jgi:hypothetical protein
MKQSDARNQVVFVIEDGKVVKTNLYDFVMISHDYGSSINLKTREIEDKEGVITYEAYVSWGWGTSYNESIYISSTDEEEFEEYLFDYIYEGEFYKDDQRDTCYYDDYEDAFASLVKSVADSLNIDEEVAESYLNHEILVESIKKERADKKRDEYLANKDNNDKMIKEQVYAEYNSLKHVLHQFKERYNHIQNTCFGAAKNEANSELLKEIIITAGPGKINHFWQVFRVISANINNI